MNNSKYENIWIKENGEVIFVDESQHEAGYSQKEILHNEKHWLKISNGVNVNFTADVWTNEITSGLVTPTRQQQQRYRLISESIL